MALGTKTLSICFLWLAIVAVAFRAVAEPPAPTTAPSAWPLYKLTFAPEDQSVYAPPALPREDQGINLGGVNVDIKATYLSDYIYRGVDHTNFPSRSKKPDIQFDGRLTFNTGKFPHPFIGLFVNEFSDDPVSRFQEIRPSGGFEWNLRPLTFEVGVTSYIFPEREKINTSEVFTRITFDDSILWKSDKPIFSPYGFAAYDYDLNSGWYFEAGLKHDFIIEDTGIVLTLYGDIAYISGIRREFVFVNTKKYGLHQYDAGMIASYSLNNLFRANRRYGEWTLNGYLNYTGGINRDTNHTDTRLWGGVGIGFKY